MNVAFSLLFAFACVQEAWVGDVWNVERQTMSESYFDQNFQQLEDGGCRYFCSIKSMYKELDQRSYVPTNICFFAWETS